jgi:hypothetical protein
MINISFPVKLLTGRACFVVMCAPSEKPCQLEHLFSAGLVESFFSAFFNDILEHFLFGLVRDVMSSLFIIRR